jgi:ADP-ribose pyrophosphatase YjhB (NUDIX family)
MNQGPVHVTVACVIEQDGKYLMVEEQDKTSGEMVFNQPAGHLDEGESITTAALRETLEETGWSVQLIGVLGIALYRAPTTGNTYYRTTFLARALRRVENFEIDPDIHAVHWLDYEAILARSARMRSPLALAMIERHRRGICYPLDLIHDA